MASDHPSPPLTPEDETGALLRRESPDGQPQEENIDAQLQLAKLRRQLAGVEVEPVRFRRWEIERRLGKGGMGSVYLARDPKLDRQVALKVLNAGRGEEHSANDQRLQREAQALARIRHPHVVRVHHVDLERGRTVIEMEYVQGSTLRQWQEQPRPWREVVRVYAQAGQGLAAIHAAGLVHRDIKPDNLLRADDGEVKVVDLGLAVGPRERDREVAVRGGAASLLRATITRGSGVAGTPQYMAPERFGRAEAMAAADQFSFAVSLYEALYGVLPFAQDLDGERYVEALREQRLQRPAVPVRLPRWLRQALRRALRFEPHDRYPSMTALTTALQHGLARRRWWWLGGGAVVAAAGLTTLGWAMAPVPPDPCAQLQARLLDEMDPLAKLGPLRARVVGVPHAQRTLALFEQTLEVEVARWREGRVDACEAERRGADAASGSGTAAATVACLDEARARIDATVAEMLEVREDLAGRLVEATKVLEQLPRCESKDSGVDDSAVVALRQRLEHARALELEGRMAEAEAEAQAVAEASVEHPRLQAEALYRLGHVLGSQERGPSAFATLQKARDVAYGVGYDALVCEVVAYRAKVAALLEVDLAASADDVGMATACLRRTNPRSILVRADMLEARGLLAQVAGRSRQAVQWHEQALDLRRAHLGEPSFEVSKSLHNLANAYAAIGDDARAQALFEQTLRMRETVLGPAHPQVGDAWFDLGELQRARGDLGLARESMLEAQVISLRNRGADAPPNPTIHLVLALIDRDEGELDSARAHLRSARQGQEADAELPADHPDRAQLWQTEGTVHMLGGDFRAALDAFARATALLRRHDPESPAVLDGTLKEIDMLYGLGEHVQLARRAEAEGQPLARAVAALEPFERGRFGWYIGDSSVQAGQAEQAVMYLQLALRACEELGAPESVAELRQLLQQAAEGLGDG
ncbi:MAG: protein kinase [Nannocystaceae bacterium]